MTYTPQTWNDDAAGATPVSATRLTYMETGIQQAHGFAGLPAGLTGATQPTRYVGATTLNPPTTGSFLVGDYVITHGADIWVCTSAGTPGTWRAVGDRILCTAATRPTVPYQGLFIYETDTGKHLVYYGATTGWQRTWGDSWGVVSTTSTTTASGITSGTTELVVATAATFTAVANRYYRITWSCNGIGSVANDLFDARVRLTNIAGAVHHDQRYVVIGGSLQIPITLVGITTLSAGSTVLVGTFQRAAGTGTLQTLAGLSNEITIEDIGPSGTVPAV